MPKHSPTILRNSRVRANLWGCDALEFLNSLCPSSVDLVISSPPYCVGKEYDRFTNVEQFRREITRIAERLVEVLKPTGSICWQVGNHIGSGEIFPLEYAIFDIFKSIPNIKLRNRIVWTFGHGTHAKKRFSGRHEVILWFTKSDDFFFDLDPVRVPQKYPGKRHYKGAKRGELSGNPLGKNPGDVWDIPNVKARHIEKTAHPCQFPVALARRLAVALCPENGEIIDPYMGSGSAGVAAMLSGRNFSGCDLEPRYVGIAKTRIGEALEGTAQTRPDAPVRLPNPTESVAIRPPHFRAERALLDG